MSGKAERVSLVEPVEGGSFDLQQYLTIVVPTVRNFQLVAEEV